MVCSNQPTEDGRSPQAGRATLASHQAPAGLGHAEGIPNAGAVYRGSETQMFIEYELDDNRDPTVERWVFAHCEDDPNDGYGWLEIRVQEIVPTRTSGVLAVYYRQWFTPEGTTLARPRRVVSGLPALKALIRRRNLTLTAGETI